MEKQELIERLNEVLDSAEMVASYLGEDGDSITHAITCATNSQICELAEIRVKLSKIYDEYTQVIKLIQKHTEDVLDGIYD